MTSLHVVRAEPRRGSPSARKSEGVLGPRAAWLAEVVESGAISRKTGLLLRDVWDPVGARWCRASDDLLAFRMGLISGEDD